MGALGKIADNIKKEWQKHKVFDALKDSNIGLISGLYHAYMYKSVESMDMFIKLLHEFNKKNELLFFCANNEYISFVCLRKNKDFMKRYLSKFIKYESDKVAGINLIYSDKVYKEWIVGFDAYLLDFFRQYNIGLDEYYPSGGEIVFILEEKLAYKMINTLKEIIG